MKLFIQLNMKKIFVVILVGSLLIFSYNQKEANDNSTEETHEQKVDIKKYPDLFIDTATSLKETKSDTMTVVNGDYFEVTLSLMNDRGRYIEDRAQLLIPSNILRHTATDVHFFCNIAQHFATFQYLSYVCANSTRHASHKNSAPRWVFLFLGHAV